MNDRAEQYVVGRTVRLYVRAVYGYGRTRRSTRMAWFGYGTDRDKKRNFNPSEMKLLFYMKNYKGGCE